MNPRLPAFVWITAAAVLSQEAPKAPAPTLAVDLVRQRVQADRLQPPTAQQGLELDAGSGPVALLVRRADGGLAVHEVRRDGDRGPAPQPTSLPPPTIEPKPGEDAEPPTVSLSWVEQSIVASRGGSAKAREEWCRGKQLDAAMLRPRLSAMLAAAKATAHAGKLRIDAALDVPTQHVLSLWEVARGLGYHDVMFGAGDPEAAKAKSANPMPALPAAASELVRGLVARFRWPTRKLGPDAEQSVADGELMLLLDGPTPWGEVAPLLSECARAGIWRIGLVAQKDAKTFVKLPTNLLVHQ